MRTAYRCRAYPDEAQQAALNRTFGGIGTRQWACPSCGTRHDRDIDAAKNVLAAGLAVTACGGDVRRAGATQALLPVKQETQRATAGIHCH